MEVGGDSGSAKAGHRGSGFSTNRQDGVRAAEARQGVEAGGAGLGVELVLYSGSEV